MENLKRFYLIILEKVILNTVQVSENNREIVPSREELTNSGKFQYFRRINDKGNSFLYNSKCRK